MRVPRLRALLPALLLAGAVSLDAQEDAAARDLHPLEGRVVEEGTARPVADAVVRVEGTRPSSAVTDGDGRWRIEALPAGPHRLVVRRAGYAPAAREVRLPRASREPVVVALAPEALPLDALVVTAARRMQRLADAPVATEVITRREIEEAGVSDLSTVLTSYAGVLLEGGHPAGEGVMLQGLGSERVLVLVDGQPVVGRVSGQLDLSRIPASMVERVEVVKGPQSSLYGSEAMGGVVNVVTRRPSGGWGGGVEAVGGTQGRTDLSATVEGTRGALSLLVEGGRRRTELTPGLADEAGALAERWDALVKLGWEPSPRWSLRASVLALDERQRWRSGQIHHFADNLQRGADLGVVHDAGPTRLSTTLHLSDFEHLSRSATAAEPVEGTGERELQRLWKGEVLLAREIGPHVLDLGVEARREEVSSDRVRGRDRSLHAVEPFARATWTSGGWSVVPGVRLSWSDPWGTHLTPSLAALWRPVPGLGLRASVGRGFRAPAFKELYMEFLNTGPGYAYTVRGNPDLRPETSTNLSGSAEWARGRVYLRAQAFYNRFEDFIETRLVDDSAGVSVYTYGNVVDGSTRGAELEGGLVWNGLRAEGGYAFLHTRDETTGEPLLGRPAHSARLSLRRALPAGFRSVATGLFTGSAPVRRTETGTVERDAFVRLDAQLSRGLPGGLEATLGVRNLFDARPDDWPGYAGRHLYLGLGWRTDGIDDAATRGP